MTDNKLTFALLFLVLSLTFVLGSATDAFAASVPIDLPGFESPTLRNGYYTPAFGTHPTEWTFSAGSNGIFNPSIRSFQSEAHGGQNTAFVNTGSICQELSTPVEGDTKYTLSAWVGSRGEVWWNFYSLPNLFTIKLMDDSNTLLASLDYTDASAVVPTRGQWAENTLEHTVLAGDPSIGNNLKICLTSLRAQSNFDDVRLDATPLTGSIHGQKYEDVNLNGQRGDGEPYLNGWTIFLDDNSNGILDGNEVDRETHNDPQSNPGFYWFTELPLGDYTVCEVLQDGWVQTQPGTTETPECYDVTLSSAGQEIVKDFGNFELGSIHGQKYEDVNLNGQRDDGEPYLNGWTIFLDENDNQTLDDGEVDRETHNDPYGNPGFYWFTELPMNDYTVCEVLQDGWVQTQPGTTETPECHNVTINSSGQEFVKDFGNFNATDGGATLTVIKKVINDNGGTAVSSDFTMNVDNPFFGSTSFDGASGGTAISIGVGSTTVTEDNFVGYTSDGGVGNCNFAAQYGGEYTCTITNNDKGPGLTLVKQVINDNGGTATPSDFTLTATGTTGFSGAGPTVSSDDAFEAGTYALSESTLDAYTAGEWECTGDGIQVDNTITLELGESATCTITNNDDAPTLTLTNTVTNDNGGTSIESDFTLTATGSTPFSGAGPTVSSDDAFEAGTYALSDSGPASHMSSSWVCDNGVQGGPNSITLSIGESVTCEVVNDDIPPGLTIELVLNNGEDGASVPSDFTLTATGSTPFSGAGPMVQSGPGIEAGVYDLTITESEVYGYSDWTCTGGNQTDSDSVSLGFGDVVLCSITLEFLDNCPGVSNPEQYDSNNDGVGDACATSSGGGNESETRPTFGISHETQGTTMVDSGFSFNGNSFSITDNHHTPFDQQTIEIGPVNSFTATVYADKDLKVQEFLFGIPEVGMGHLAEMRVEVWYDNTGEIQNIKVIQDTEVIDRTSLKVTHQKSKCLDSDTEENCDTTFMSAVFLEPLADDVMAIKAIDFKLRDQTSYLNDGFDVSGDSLNLMETKMIPSPTKGEGLIEVTQNEKYSSYWITEDGRIFEMNIFGSFKQINTSFERFQDSGDTRTRAHSEYGLIVQYEKNRALDIFDSAKLISELPDSFSHDILISERMTEEMMQEMVIQEHIAQKTFDELVFKQTRWN